LYCRNTRSTNRSRIKLQAVVIPPSRSEARDLGVSD
jgi:hypothetical protein